MLTNRLFIFYRNKENKKKRYRNGKNRKKENNHEEKHKED